MVDSPFGFVDVVAARRELVVSSAGEHVCRLEPRNSDLAWQCDLDDGTPTDDDRDPAAYVRWVCTDVRVGRSSTGTATSVLEVRRSGPQSDLGRLVKGFGRLAGRLSGQNPVAAVDEPYVYTDPAGILDNALRQRIENWPSAPHGDGVVRPAELSSIRLTGEGLVVESVSWWDSAPALDHQLTLAVDIARRLRSHGSD